MKKTVLSAAIAAALAIPAVSAFAEDAPPASPLSFNVGVVSDYLFRGVTQTHGDPALQGGIDYAFSNGFYIGTWASTISWVKDYSSKGTVELDLYGGYKGAFANPDFTYDVGYIAYTYPGHGKENGFGSNPTTTEVYGSLGYKDFSVKYSYATSNHFISWIGTTSGSTRGSNYLEGNYSHDLGDGWGVSAHIGHQIVEHLSVANYTDWKIGATKDVGFGVVGLAYSSTNAKGSCANAEPYCWGNSGAINGVSGATGGFKNVAKGTAVLSFLKTF